MHPDRGSTTERLPTLPLSLAAINQLGTKQLGPEPTCAVRIISRELDKPGRFIHAADNTSWYVHLIPSAVIGLSSSSTRRTNLDSHGCHLAHEFLHAKVIAMPEPSLAMSVLVLGCPPRATGAR